MLAIGSANPAGVSDGIIHPLLITQERLLKIQSWALHLQLAAMRHRGQAALPFWWLLVIAADIHKKVGGDKVAPTLQRDFFAAFLRLDRATLDYNWL